MGRTIRLAPNSKQSSWKHVCCNFGEPAAKPDLRFPTRRHPIGSVPCCIFGEKAADGPTKVMGSATKVPGGARSWGLSVPERPAPENVNQKRTFYMRIRQNPSRERQDRGRHNGELGAHHPAQGQVYKQNLLAPNLPSHTPLGCLKVDPDVLCITGVLGLWGRVSQPYQDYISGLYENFACRCR